MSEFNLEQRTWLARQFEDRANFRKAERKLYGHDIAAIPRLLKPVIGSAIPGAVVQPETEDELVKLVTWAKEQGIALTPRGKATSGYGGALPVRQGW